MTIQAQLADGRVLEFPDGTDPSVVQATVKKVIANPMAAQSTASLESAKAAPFSFGDIAKSFGAGVVGGAKSLVDVVGAGSGVSQGLGEAQDYLQRSLSPERQAEIARDQELMNRAQDKGIGSEIMAGLKTVAHAPFQSIAQGVGSSLPAIVGGLVTLPESAPAALALGVQRASSLLIAAAQGVGETKGNIHDEVKKAYMDQGVPEAEAAKLAVKAQEYTLEKAPMLIGSAAFGALDALTGFEKSTSRALKDAFKGEERKLEGKGLKAAIAALPEKAPELPTLAKSALHTAGEEGLTEALQGGYGQAAQNIGMSQAGFETPTMQGVGGAAAHDALIGALTGGAMSPLHFQGAKADYAADQFLREVKGQQEQEKAKADALKEQQETRAKTEQGLNVPKMLALPAPAKAAEEEKDPLQNPVGRVTEDELGKAIGNNTVVNYLNKYRKDNNLPKLKSYSIEDIKDAMTAQNPEGEEGALNAILAYKTNYQNETYTPEDIQNRAVAKNVATETKGFSDFLTRATGKSDLNTMTQPELHSVATALDALPRTGKEQQLVLPEGSNATRFTQDQYNQGVTQALMNVKEGKPVTLDQAREAIKAQTDLKTDRDADHLLKTAASNEDLIVEKGTGFQAVSPGGTVLGTYGTEAEAKRKHRRADILPVETQLVRAPEEVNQEKVAQLPEGYEINKKTVAGEAGPAAYVVREDGSQTNASQTFADEADAKDRLNILARKREANAVAEEAAADRIRQDLKKRQSKIAQMEADGQTDTAEHKNAVAAFQAANVAGSAKITEHLDKAEAFRKPLKIVPLGKKTAKVEKHTVIKKGKEVASFPDRVKAEQHILASASEAELQAIADRGGIFGKRAQTELQDRQRTEPGIKVKGTAEGLEKAGVRTPEVEAKLKELEAKLKPMLDKFGLGEVGLNVVRAIENDAEGAWGGLNNLIRIAFNADNPIRTMRHEALHALKDLGFFTPQQWEALKREAKKTWVDKYLKGVPFNDTMSRFDAYTNMGLSDEAILEEAIADAFGSWEGGAKPPPGMMAALFKRLQQFFAALRQALTGAGFESADEIFGKIERGELKAGKEAAGTEAKLSLAEKESKEKIDPNDVSRVVIDGPYADAAIRTMNSQITQTSKPLEVDDVGRLFDKAFMDQFKRKGDWKSPADFQRAVAQAVTELKHQLQQTKSGLDWYEEDIADAFKQTQKYIPSLKKPEKRALFSVIAGIMSPSVNARDNWVIAAQAYQHYEKTGILPGSNPATGSLWQGGLESANKKKQLDMLNAMLQPKSKGGLGEKATVEWLQGDHTVAEITNFRKKYGGMGKSSTGGKASDILPGFTAFGPKVGPFVMNINGIHDVTVDVWMTRTFNRYFGQMMGPDGTMLRSPTEPQRVAIKKLAIDAAAQLGIKPYQVQSTLWFFEQQLFNKLGTGAKSYGFSDGAIKFIESQGGTAPAKGAPANVGANAPANKPAGKQAVGNSAQAARPSTGQQGVSGEQKLSLGRNADRVSFVGPAFDERKLRGAGDRGRGSEVRNLAPLEGSPSVKGFSGPDPRLVSIAEQYAKDNGIDYRRQKEYVQVDEDRARRIADAYDKMEHAPQDPEVKEAYQNLIRQTRAQYDALVKNGYKFWFTDYNIPDNAEYLSSPWNAMRDIRANKTMGVFPTNEGFGTTEFDPAANPLLEDTGLEWPVGSPNSTKKSPVLANDLFRAVHDAFGHGLEGAGFRARGEENAWLAHSKLFTGSALAAITSETRGQNSWLNYGPQGEKNRTAKIEDTTFADQKTGLMPSWTWQEGQDKYSLKFAEPALKPKQGEGIVLGEKQPDAQTFVGLHYGQNKVDELSGSKYGTGIKGAERRRLADTDDQRIKKRIYFYIPKEDGSMPRNEAGLGGHVYTQQFDNIAAGPVVDRLFSEAGGDANQFESNVVDAGYDGYAMPSMGMMVILNHDTPVQYHGTMGELVESDKKFSLRAAPDTPEFKRWFGNSDAIDKDGKPLVVYTATNKDFTVFEPGRGASKDAIAAWVTSDKDFVNNYASVRYRYWKTMHRPWEEDQMIPNGVHIVPAYVNPKNPLDVTNLISDLAAPINDSEAEKVADQLQVSKDDLLDAIPEKDIYPNGRERDHTRISSDLVRTKFAVDAMRRLGFDSVKARESGASVYALFDSNQIKSAISNKGTYSGPDIRYSLRTYFPTAEEAEKAAYQKAPPATPEFKRFFGASKVMEEGRPQVMYHGSPNEFDTFRDGMPIFVSPDPEFAEQFGRDRAKDDGKDPNEAKVYPLWVRAETPFDYENPDHVKKIADAIIAEHYSKTDESIVRLKQSRPTVKKFREELADGLWSVIEDPIVQTKLKELGFDSFNVKEGGNKNLAVFNANQVKSVTGNIGDFSENKSIKYSLPNIGAAADARVNETTQTREHKGWLERVTDWLKPENMADLRASFIHRYNQLGVYDRLLAEKMGGKVLLADMSAEAAANMSDLSASVTASVFGIGNRKGGIPVYKNGMTTVDTSVRGPLQILAPLAQFNDPKAYQHYQYWAGVKRGMRYEADGKEKNFDKGDIALAEKVRQEYLAKGVDFNAIQKEMNVYNDGLVDYMVQTGVIAPERGAEFKKHMDYIPFYRQINGEDTVGPKIFNSISGVKPPKKLKGSEAPLTDYLESIVQNTQAAINAGMKNMAAQRAINVAIQLGPRAGAQRLNVVNSAPDCVQVLENGKQVSYRVADQLFINAVKSLNMAEMPFLGIFSAPSNLLRNLVTKDPGFMLANLARDSLSAWVTSGSKMTPIAGTVSKFVEALGGKSPALHALLNAGILGGYEFSSGVIKSGEVLEKDLNKKYGAKGGFKPLKTFTGIWDALEHGTEASDAATRMAVYERVLAETGNETEALYRALEVMNFNRKGSSPVVRILTAAIPFLNARIQGLDVFYRTAMGTNVSANAKEMQKAFFVRGATLMALSAAYFLAVSDDDEWKKQEQETKDNYWIAPGIGKFPTPFEVGFLFKTVPERIMAYTMKDDTGQDFMASMQRGLLNTFAFNPIPQIAKPIIEYNANYNFFTGRPIVGQGMEGLEPKYQVGPNTTKTAEALGNLLGMPPIKLDQLINSYTGTMGMYAMSVIDAVLDTQDNSPHASKRFEQLPIIKRFALDPEARGNITQYYELKKAVDAATQTENYLLKAGKPDEFREFMEQNKGLLAIKPYVSSVESTMKQMREMRKMVQGAEMSADEKRDTLTAIGQAENNLNANIQTIKKMISEVQ
jgi:hypothetical protein